MSKHTNHFPNIQLPPKEDFTLDPRWCVVNADADTTHCILMLAGRSQKQNLLPSIYWYHGLKEVLMVGIQTKAHAWYPLPKGPMDQWSAKKGIPDAIAQINIAIGEIKRRWNIPKSKIALLGFSAGGVMAVQTAAWSKEPFAGVLCQSGAILAPKELPKCKHPAMPVLLTHSQDDDVFEWGERYTPMKDALIKEGYCLSVVESPTGGHSLNDIDIAFGKMFVRRCFDGL